MGGSAEPTAANQPSLDWVSRLAKPPRQRRRDAVSVRVPMVQVRGVDEREAPERAHVTRGYKRHCGRVRRELEPWRAEPKYLQQTPGLAHAGFSSGERQSQAHGKRLGGFAAEKAGHE